MRFLSWFCLFSIISLRYSAAHAQKYRVDVIQNCQMETRTVTFYSQVSFFRRCIEGRGNIRNQKLLLFSPSYAVDTVFLEQQIEKVKKTLPAGFFVGPVGDRYNNSPDEKAIWFEVLFSREEKTGKNINYAAYRITFDGDDARIDRQRMAPKITNIQFIFDKSGLLEISKHLKSLSPVQ
jgi:hypothetical protein